MPLFWRPAGGTLPVTVCLPVSRLSARDYRLLTGAFYVPAPHMVGSFMPAYLCTGASVIAFVLFVCDGIVICGTAFIVSLRLLRKTAQDESRGE